MTSPPSNHCNVAVAHYGHRDIKVKHWAIVVMLDSVNALEYQISGSTMTYELMPIGSVTLLDNASYLGKVCQWFWTHALACLFCQVVIGTIDKNRLPDFGTNIAKGRIVHGDLNWNCQNWVVERLHDLKIENYAVRELDQTWLLDQLANSQR